MNKEQYVVRSRIADEIYTCCAFCVAASALPVLAASYVVVRVSRYLWLKLLSSRYPDLEFIKTDTVRSLLDTHRNQGIINVLLSIKGTHDLELLKHHLSEHVINKRDKNGDLTFPRVRHQLVSCWGNYAWNANVVFKIENHVIVANAVYRGRPVGENNIQEYVSEIVSKFFPSDHPPWQYIIIPCISTQPKYYVLIRVHHLLLTGKKSLNIGDLLMLEQLNASDRETTTTSTTTEYTQQSPLTKLYPTPSAIPQLMEKLNEYLSNAWNEFVSEYDPVECPRVSKTLPGSFHVAGLILISAVSALRELNKKSNGSARTCEASVATFSFLNTLQRECNRRNLTVHKIALSPLVTTDPRKWPRLFFGTTLSSIRIVINLPFRVRRELQALSELRTYGYARSPDTLTWQYAELGQLCVAAIGEATRGMVEVYRAPARLWTETVGVDDGKRHLLQTVSLCGRKVTAWSRPVQRAGIERAARALAVSSTDIVLYGATEAMRTFFEHSHAEPPNYVLATARAAPDDFLFTFAEGYGKNYKKSHTGGMVCLPLALGASPRRINACVERACARQTVLAGGAYAQARCGAVTRALPSTLIRLVLNVLSRRFALSYAEIDSPPHSPARCTLWGDTVDGVIYWRPSQANISMSLTVIQYANTVRLAVMADARLAPAHMIPASRWPTAIEQLVRKIDQEIAKITAQAYLASGAIPKIVTTQETSGYDKNDQSKEESNVNSDMLQPPPTTVASPPPVRRQITYN